MRLQACAFDDGEYKHQECAPEKKCPVIPEVCKGSWGAWGTCSVTCGDGGTRERIYTVNSPECKSCSELGIKGPHCPECNFKTCEDHDKKEEQDCSADDACETVSDNADKAWFCEQNVVLGVETDPEGEKSAAAAYLQQFAEKISPSIKVGLLLDHRTAWGGGWSFGVAPKGFDAPASFWPPGLSVDLVLANHCRGEYGCGGNARNTGSLMEDQKFAGIMFGMDR